MRVSSDLRARIFSIKPYSPAVPVAVAMVASVNTIVVYGRDVINDQLRMRVTSGTWAVHTTIRRQATFKEVMWTAKQKIGIVH